MTAPEPAEITDADEDREPVYWFCNSCGEEVDDEGSVCCDDGENEPSYDD